MTAAGHEVRGRLHGDTAAQGFEMCPNGKEMTPIKPDRDGQSYPTWMSRESDAAALRKFGNTQRKRVSESVSVRVRVCE